MHTTPFTPKDWADVEAQVPWAPDIEVHQGITIYSRGVDE